MRSLSTLKKKQLWSTIDCIVDGRKALEIMTALLGVELARMRMMILVACSDRDFYYLGGIAECATIMDNSHVKENSSLTMYAHR